MANDIEISKEQDDEIDLGALLFAFWRLFKRFWWIIPVLALVGAGAGYVKNASTYRPMYRSTASFTVVTESGSSDGFSFYYDNLTAGQLAATFPYILSSSLLTDAIKEDLGVDAVNGSISAQAVSDSNLITMSVTSSSPSDAKAILESAIRVYPDVSRFVIGATRFNMIETPTEPTEPYNTPNYSQVAVKWGLAGAGAGIVLLLIGALFKKTVQKPDELNASISLQCLGSIPEVRFKARGNQMKQEISCLDSRTPQNFKESIRSLWLRIQRDMEKDENKILLVTSTVSGEGKSVIAMNLACTAAASGKKVLLIDGDLRKNRKSGKLEKTAQTGLTDLVSGTVSLDKTIFRDKQSGIYILGSGTFGKTSPSRNAKNDPPSAGHFQGRIVRLLGSKTMAGVLAACKKTMDLIIIDAPPCDLFSDASILAEYADSILYITRYDYLQKRRILDGVSAMEDTGVKLLGYVFNGVPVHHTGYGYYGYGRYGYGYYGYGAYGYGKYGEEKRRGLKPKEGSGPDD